MSDEVPSERLSQIFESLKSLQQQQQQLQHQQQQQQVQQTQAQLQTSFQQYQQRRFSNSSVSPGTSGRTTPASNSGGGGGSGSAGSGSGAGPGTSSGIQFHLHQPLPQGPPHYFAQSQGSYYLRPQDGTNAYLHTFPSAASQSHHYNQYHPQYQQYLLSQHYQSQLTSGQSSLPPMYGSQSLNVSPLMTKRACSFSGNLPGTKTHLDSAAVMGVGVKKTRNLSQVVSQSTPNSPRLMPRRNQKPPPIPAKPNLKRDPRETTAFSLSCKPLVISESPPSSSGPPSGPSTYNTNPLIQDSLESNAAWSQLSTLTEHLDVRQLNNYGQAVPEINWQERCLELQLELHRSKNQAGRIRDILREKLSELEQRVVEAEERAEEAEDKVRAMEQRLSEWPKPQQSNSPSQQQQTQQQPAVVQPPSSSSKQSTISSSLTSIQSTSLPNSDTDKAISSLEIQVEEQRQLRIQDARQIEAKAAKIKEWVNNKLRDLEEQNQLLREQNIKCNQQLELLKNHIANQSNRHSSVGPVRNSLSLDVQEFANNSETRRRSESLDTQEIITRPLTSSYNQHHQHRRNLSMEPSELERNLVAAVDSLALAPLPSLSKTASANARPDSSDTDTAHDYAEIYTPSCEKMPWIKNNPNLMQSGGNSSTTTTTSEPGAVPKPPTPPLHRFPSWEAKIYQVANDGLASTSSEPHDLHSMPDLQESISGAASAGSGSASNTLANGTEKPNRHHPSHSNNGTLNSNASTAPVNTTTPANNATTPGTPQVTTRQQQTASGGFCDISVPVYATVKGRASQIRSMPFTGDSSDDSSDGEDHAVMHTHNSHNSSSTDNTETSTSGSASSPSKSLKTSSSMSPAKRSGSESPKNTKGRGLSDDYALPPDAVSETTCMDASMPSLLMRQSYVDSPSKKIETLEKMGHLAKLGGKLKTWRKRWFVLKNGSLSYWKSQHDINRKPQGTILLDEQCRINKAEGASTFEIDTGKKVYYLTADSNATMDDWIRVLQNVQRRNATKLLLSREDQKPTIQGWVTKVKNGHSKKCWCVLLGKMFLYFKAPGENNPLGQINMRDARVEEVEHASDSDSEERDDSNQSQARLTVAIYPAHQGPTYLILPNKQDRDNWLYHLTVVSGGGSNAGTQYEQLVQKLMETDGDPNCVLWRHPLLLHTKDAITSPLSTLHTEAMHPEAIKLFKSIQLFMSVAVNQPGIDYHVILAQNALQHCLDMPELHTEMICILIKQTSRHTGQKLSVGVQVNKKLGKQTRAPVPPPIIDCKSNPPAYSFVQGWQLLALAVSLFVPKSSRMLWYLKLHLSRNADTKTETGKYAAYCERALERTLKNGGRETKPSRMEVLSILLKNPYHHSLPHAIPVHMMNSTYQVISFDGSTTIEEFQTTLAHEIGTRDASNGFCLFSDDPIEKDLEHYLDPLAKLCDVISKWETALREKGSGKFENSRVIQLTYKNRLYWKHTVKFETDKERLLLCYQTNAQIVQGRFPLSRDLALELASLMSQIDMGDYSHEKSRSTATNVGLKALDKFYPYRYRDALNPEQLKEVQELLISKWMLLKGRSTLDCVRIYLTCCRKWPFFGASLFQAKPRHCEQATVAWLAVAEDALNVLELSTMAPVARYPYTSVMTFGGCQDDFMLVVSNEDTLASCGSQEQKLLFAMSKPKILEITLLIADYMNALGHTVPGTPHMNSLTRNGSQRSLRSRPNPATGGTTTAGFSTNATTTAHNTLNSHATHTLNSNHSHTLSSSHYSGSRDLITGERSALGGSAGPGGPNGIVTGTQSHQGTLNSSHSHHQHHHNHHHHQHQHQPDILKSTPDHQRIK